MRILTFEAKSDRKHWQFKLRLAKYRLLEVEPNFANQVSSKYNSESPTGQPVLFLRVRVRDSFNFSSEAG